MKGFALITAVTKHMKKKRYMEFIELVKRTAYFLTRGLSIKTKDVWGEEASL